MVLDKVLSAPLRAKRKGDDVDFEGFPNHGADESDRDEGDNMSDGFDEEGGSVGSLEDEDEGSESEPDIQSSLNQLSFGALAKAQEQYPVLKKKGRSISHDNPEKPDTGTSDHEMERKKTPVEKIREQIRAAREERLKKTEKPGSNDKKSLPSRTSKHAPTVQTSTRAVTRKRIVVEPPPVPKARDPRFDSAVLSNGLPNSAGAVGSSQAAARQNYSFLDKYRTEEIDALKKQLAKTKNTEEKDRLKRVYTSMMDRNRAFERKEREKRIASEHRKQERELIREGKKKNPHYLKHSELVKKAQVERYNEMSGRERSKALQKRRKKMASKEKKGMPYGRRELES